MTSVAITTDRFFYVAPLFASRGMEPVETPCVRVDPGDDEILDRARDAAKTAGLLLISSARALEVLWPDGSMPPVDVVVVGERTAVEARARGGRVVTVGTGGLLDLVDATAPRLVDSRVVFPHAHGADPKGLAALRQITNDLVEIEIYKAVPIAPGPVSVDAVAFASPSAVSGWLLARDLNSLVVGVIGPTTAEAVARYRAPDVVAPIPSHRELAKALASHLEVSV